jgi:hypothetical protein
MELRTKMSEACIVKWISQEVLANYCYELLIQDLTSYSV